MAELIDRPGELNLTLYVGRMFTVDLNFPAALSPRTFTVSMDFGGTTRTYTPTIVSSTHLQWAIPAAHLLGESAGQWQLIETSGGGNMPYIAGRVRVTREAGPSSTSTSVSISTSTVNVTTVTTSTVTVFATLAETIAGTASDKAVTPAGLMKVVESYNVMRAGALGVGDDSTAFASAASAVNAAGGGRIYVPPGIWRTVNTPIYSKNNWFGAGKGATVVQVLASTNGQAFLTDQWVSQTGTNTGGGPTGWSISNMTIDANGANNASGYGLLIYGSDFVLEHLDIINARTAGINSEWSATVLGPNPMAARLFDVKTWTPYGAIGILWNGPHDSHWRNVESICTLGTATQIGFSFGAKSLGTNLAQCHVWGSHTWAAVIDGNSIWFNQCYLEGGQTGQLLVRAADGEFLGGWIYGNDVAGVKGVELGVVSGAAATGWEIDTRIVSCRGGAIGLVNQVSNKIRAHVSYATAPSVAPVYGTATNTDWSDLSVQVENYAAGDEVEQFRRRGLFHNRSTAASPVLITKGHSSQSGPMQSWRTSLDVELASVEVNGSMKTSGAWNGSHLLLGANHLWFDAAGKLRTKASAPTSDTDGVVVGTQT
jgi:hypothetical protein